jgi:hypothetical protein
MSDPLLFDDKALLALVQAVSVQQLAKKDLKM